MRGTTYEQQHMRGTNNGWTRAITKPRSLEKLWLMLTWKQVYAKLLSISLQVWECGVLI
jgi:hypothetical protein